MVWVEKGAVTAITFSCSAHSGLDLILRLATLEGSTDDGVGDVLRGLSGHHVRGHVETQFLGELLELLNLVISDGITLSVGCDSDGTDGTDEKEDGGEFHFC